MIIMSDILKRNRLNDQNQEMNIVLLRHMKFLSNCGMKQKLENIGINYEL